MIKLLVGEISFIPVVRGCDFPYFLAPRLCYEILMPKAHLKIEDIKLNQAINRAMGEIAEKWVADLKRVLR